MLLKYFYDKPLAQAAYMVGCQATGEALVIDPARDITPYLKAAEEEGLRITQVTETHIHADFVSGSRELASQTGATLYLSDMGDADWKYQFVDANTVLLYDGDTWKLGNIKITAIHTPGHTPEHMVFQITDTAAADEPMGIFTGDLLFVGSLGRPDLLEEAAGVQGTKVPGARQQFHNIQRLKTMPDYLQIWPGHGAGSACGKGLGAIPSSTLGYEKRFNPSFHIGSEEDFVEWLLDEQPEPPFYFARMKYVNKVGPTLLRDLPEPVQLNRAELEKWLQSDALVIDSRPGEMFADGHLPSTINIPANSSNFNTYAGWLVDFNKPVVLIADDWETTRLISELRAVGVDNIVGIASTDLAIGPQTIPQITAQELAQDRNGSTVIDVRWRSEYQEVHLPNSTHIPLGYIVRNLDTLARDQHLIVHCQAGVRSVIAASILQKYGFKNVTNLAGGIEAWQKAGLPIERGVLETEKV
ncbi:MAG: MBL fold metallo-hydrolase [Chloroflexi bacterium]|nr:MBL fold metallo-hydrolase [Chloroflexota bacterium]